MKTLLFISIILFIGNTSYGQNCLNGRCFNKQVQFAQPNNLYNNQIFYEQQVSHAIPIVQAQKEVQIVNNLIGIPVPVAYDRSIASQGSTIYGYSSVAEAHGNIDLGLLYNQAARLTEQAQQLAGQANVDFSRLIEIEGSNRAEVAKIIAQGQAARDALSAVRVESATPLQTRSFAFKITSSESGEFELQKIDENYNKFDISGNSMGNISDLLQDKCVACHNSSTAQGGLNLLEEISSDQQESILNRIITDDPVKRMPRNADGSASPRLKVGELKLFFNAMGK